MKHMFTQHGTEVRVDGVPLASCIDPQSASAVRDALDFAHNGIEGAAQPLRWPHTVALVLGAVGMLALAGIGAFTLSDMLLEALHHG